MKVCFFHSDKPRERLLADAFADGVREAGRGDTIELKPLTAEVQIAEADVAVMVGVKSRELFQANWRAGVHTLMIDKGYTRHAAPGPIKLWEYWRVAVDAHHPTTRLMEVRRPHDRFEALGLKVEPWRHATQNGHIVLAGSSQKYHDFYGMSDPTRWAEKLVTALRIHTQREIVYRPKPSWREAVPIADTTFSQPPKQIEDVLRGAHCLVTHGSNACFEAVLAGIPCIVLGDAVAKPISSTSIDEIHRPKLADQDTRMQWLANLAYCQWTLPEFARGEPWMILRSQFYGQPKH